MEEKLRRYNEILCEKNKVMNLTAHSTVQQSWDCNVQDSLLFIDAFPKQGKMLDIGSGCGSPAIPIKITLPQLDVTMLDSVNKKVDFLNQVVKDVGLEGIRALHTRIEDFEKREYFDFVTARAVAPLQTLLEYAVPFLKVGGLLFAYKGSKWEEEIAASGNALLSLGAAVKEIKLHDSSRSLIIIVKQKVTPKKYPRAKNLPRTKPL